MPIKYFILNMPIMYFTTIILSIIYFTSIPDPDGGRRPIFFSTTGSYRFFFSPTGGIGASLVMNSYRFSIEPRGDISLFSPADVELDDVEPPINNNVVEHRFQCRRALKALNHSTDMDLPVYGHTS